MQQKINIAVQGKGDSLWGESSGTYRLTSVTSHYQSEEDENFTSVNVFGKNTDWCQYTDSQIEKQVLRLLRPVLKQMFGRTIKSLTWSEQGLQPSKGWNFDVTLGKPC